MSTQYTEVMTRERFTGCIDKLALIDQLASNMTLDREFAEAVLRLVPNGASTAQDKAAAWCTYVEQLPYHRDPQEVEVFRDPRETLVKGGDCDDLTLLCVAGLRCLAIPAIPEALCDEEGWAFHVRVLVGLPPLNPTVWASVDPVWMSERQWAMADVPSSSLPLGRSTQSMTVASSTPSSSPMTVPLLLLVLAAALALWRRMK